MKKLLLISAVASMAMTQDYTMQSTPAQAKSGFLLGPQTSLDFGLVSPSFSIGLGSFSTGLIGGYQHYFDVPLGIRLLGMYNRGGSVATEFSQDLSNLTYIFSTPWWVGARIDVFWDFWRSANFNHALGISLGIEYDYEYWHARRGKVGDRIYPLRAFSQHNLYPILGFYYHYKHHQIGLDYRFSGILTAKGKTDVLGPTSVRAKYSFKELYYFSWLYRF